MSPQRSSRLAYWHAGGAIESRAGSMTLQRAAELFVFYVREALRGFERGDTGGAIYCARSSLEIAHAIIECEAWNRSAVYPGVRLTHEFSRIWLSDALIVKKLLNILDRLGQN
ncbi:MAG TPA: hypothetical protein VN814_19645 [Caulobacteraceae bacterium]|nr:hypothetical protein [Caulobacteraceae bacterium]